MTETVIVSIRMSPEQRDTLMQLGDGNISAGFRALYKAQFTTRKAVDGRTAAARMAESVAPPKAAKTVAPVRFIGKRP
jgi:hypothetical protein